MQRAALFTSSFRPDMTRIGGMEFVRLAGGVCKIGESTDPQNPVRDTYLEPGLLFACHPITNLHMDAYTRAMGKMTHALIEENPTTHAVEIVERVEKGSSQDLKDWMMRMAKSRPELAVAADAMVVSDAISVVPENATSRLRQITGYAHRQLDKNNRPAVMISWYQVLGFFDYMSAKTGRHWRFPTAEEWQAVALAGRDPETTKYGTRSGDEKRLQEEAHFCAESTCGVNRLPENPWGVRDMAGNVSQWVSDYRFKDDQTLCRVVLGGHWSEIAVEMLRISCLGYVQPDWMYPYIGARAVIEP